MRTLDQCFGRSAPRTFQEEGRGLGFSIGGWHPFRANTYLPTLKKLDPLAKTGLGKAIWKPIEKINQTVNKDFAKAKKWSQDHRKQLQTAAALAAVAVGGYYAYGALTAGSGAGAAAGAAAGESTIATAALTGETLVPLATAAPGLSLVPAAVPTVGAVASSFTPIAAASSGGGILSMLGTTAQSLAPLMALSKMMKGPEQPTDGFIPYADGSIPGAYGPGSGWGGGGGMGPGEMVEDLPEILKPETSWLLPIGLGLGLFYLMQE